MIMIRHTPLSCSGHATFGARVGSLLRHVRLAALARKQRRALASLDDATLRDIGVSRSEAYAEARRNAWDVPPSWLR